MTHENNIAELLGSVYQPGNNAEVEQVLGLGESTNVAVKTANDTGLTEQQLLEIQRQEEEINAMEAAANAKQIIAPDLGEELPAVFGYWDGFKWNIEIKDGTGSRFLDPRKRNLFKRAMGMALRRFERKRQFQFRVSGRKPASVERSEIESALEESRKAGTLDPWPPAR